MRRPSAWHACRFLTASVLPVRLACNLSCSFCFSKSSISALAADRIDWSALDVEAYYRRAVAGGATRLVITGGGEPLLAPEATLALVARGRPYFAEIACFTNGSLLTPGLADALFEAGLSYLCWSRHHHDDAANRRLMGEGAPSIEAFFAAARGHKVRATCVMTKGGVEARAEVDRYIERLAAYGVREMTFKHTYVAYPESVFRGSAEDSWAAAHAVNEDPFGDEGDQILSLPWGPRVRRIGGVQLCYYWEPTPAWEKEHRLCRSINLLSDGTVYASLEDERSRLYRLPPSPPRSTARISSASGPSSP